MLLGLLCVATPVIEEPKLAPGSMALRLLDTNSRGENASSDQRSPQLQRAIAASLAAIAAPTPAATAVEHSTAAEHSADVSSIQQQQANTHGDNVSSDQQTPLQRAIAASLAAIGTPATASDRAVSAAAAHPAAGATLSPPASPILSIPASVVAPTNSRTAEAVYAVGVMETGSTVEHAILGLLFVGIVFFIIDCCGPELSRMLGCRRSRRGSIAKSGR